MLEVDALTRVHACRLSAPQPLNIGDDRSQLNAINQALRAHALSTAQARAWRAIVACRTPALGGQLLRCEGCGAQQWRWHSCRNRHCPECQSRARDAWRAARLAELLAVPYCHLVFTLPHEVNALASVHPRWVYDTLMSCTAATLTEFAADARWLGGIGALQALSRVFRGKFIQALQDASDAGTLPRDPAATDSARRQRVQALRRHDWVVYAKTPLAGPAAVLDYLARYTHRTAIGNERLVGIDGNEVRLRVRADATGGKGTIALEGTQFIARLLQHVLPAGFKRIRHYGLLAPAAKAQRMALARQLLAMPAPNPQAREDAQAFMRRVAAIEIDRCPHCKTGHWLTLQALAPLRGQALASSPASCRGPP